MSNYKYIPAKQHQNLKPLVQACVLNDIGFDFWGDEEDPPVITSILIRVSAEIGAHVVMNDMETRIWMHDKHGKLLRKKTWTTIDDFVQYVKENQ